MLYELLTGAVPFEGETAVAIAFKQVSAEPRPPSALNPAIPPALDAIVLRALAKDPGQRFADADEFLAALEREREAAAERSRGAPLPRVAPRRAGAARATPRSRCRPAPARCCWRIRRRTVRAGAALRRQASDVPLAARAAVARSRSLLVAGCGARASCC